MAFVAPSSAASASPIAGASSRERLSSRAASFWESARRARFDWIRASSSRRSRSSTTFQAASASPRAVSTSAESFFVPASAAAMVTLVASPSEPSM